MFKPSNSNQLSFYHCVIDITPTQSPLYLNNLHSKNWHLNRIRFEQKLKNTALIYCIGVCAYVIGSTQYQLVIQINNSNIKMLSDRDVVFRWSLDHDLPQVILDWLDNKLVHSATIKQATDIIALWRHRFTSIDWFLKELNDSILVITGCSKLEISQVIQFRYRCSLLTNTSELLAAMGLIDLSDIRNKGRQYRSEYTQHNSYIDRQETARNMNSVTSDLVPFLDIYSNPLSEGFLPFSSNDYLYLLNWSSKHNSTSRLFLLDDIPSLLSRFTISPVSWLRATSSIEKMRLSRLACRESIQHAEQALSIKKLKAT